VATPKVGRWLVKTSVNLWLRDSSLWN